MSTPIKTVTPTRFSIAYILLAMGFDKSHCQEDIGDRESRGSDSFDGCAHIGALIYLRVGLADNYPGQLFSEIKVDHRMRVPSIVRPEHMVFTVIRSCASNLQR